MRYKVMQRGKRRYLSVQGPWHPKLLQIMQKNRLTDLEYRNLSREGPVQIDFLSDHGVPR